ncbi:SET domain-containing protein, partial [Periconia macrospinosa]
IQLKQIAVNKRNPGSVAFFRTVAVPYVYSSTVTIVEDEDGDVAKLTVGNLEDSPVDPILTEGSIIAIKQPCWSRLGDSDYHIRVDHPSDLVILRPEDALVPKAWRRKEQIEAFKDAAQLKKEGDMMFLKKKFRRALDLYNQGLSVLSKTSEPSAEIDLYRKRCGVNIVLLRLDDAANDLSKAISVYAKSSSDLSSSQLTNIPTIHSWLHDGSNQDPLDIASRIPRALKELAARIKFDLGIQQPSAVYNIPLISSYVGPLSLHVDVANYTCDTEVKTTATQGRGLYAKRAFQAGELVSVEKAFVLPGLQDETAAPRPGAWLFKELVQKLRWNPSLRKEFFSLDDGGYWKECGWEVADDEDVPVDVFRVEFIRRYNSFSAPTRSADLINQPPNANPELRNGFWIHSSYSNHSCLPNAVRTFMGDIRFMRAVRNIAPGEEITTQYISPDIDYDARQEKFRSTWGFECTCELCEVESKLSKDTKQERLRHFEELRGMVMKLGEKGTTVTAIKKIARGVRELEALYTPNGEEETDPYAKLPRLALVHPTLFLTEAWRGVKNHDRMMDSALKLLRNFGIFVDTDGGELMVVGNAGMINIETVRALKYMSEGYGHRQETGLQGQALGLARSWYLTITGAEQGFDDFMKL